MNLGSRRLQDCTKSTSFSHSAILLPLCLEIFCKGQYYYCTGFLCSLDLSVVVASCGSVLNNGTPDNIQGKQRKAPPTLLLPPTHLNNTSTDQNSSESPVTTLTVDETATTGSLSYAQGPADPPYSTTAPRTHRPPHRFAVIVRRWLSPPPPKFHHRRLRY